MGMEPGAEYKTALVEAKRLTARQAKDAPAET